MITIEFDRQRLVCDVINACYVISRRMPDDGSDDGERRALIADVAESGNRHLLYHSLDKAFSDVAMAAGAIPAQNGSYSMEADIPEGRSNRIALRIRELARRYMVEQAVRDWLLTAAPELADRYNYHDRLLLDELRGLRVWGRSRIRPHPF